jgi:hypothetical protein
MHEFLRFEDIQGVLSHEANGGLDMVFRGMQSDAAIIPACERDHGRQTCKREHHERAR